MIESIALKLSEAGIEKSPLAEIAKSVENKNMNVSELDKPIVKDIVSLDKNGNIYKKNGELVPDNEYIINEITYKTDSNGNIELFSGEISNYTPEAERDTVAQLEAGGKDRKIGDDGGHLIARIFEGASGIENLVPMRSTINRSDFKRMENEIKEAIENGNKVNISGEIKREENNSRPSEIKVNISYNDRNSEFIFDNNKGSLKLEAELEKSILREDFENFSEEINDMIEDGKEVSITSIKKEFNINGKLEKVIVGYKDETTLGEKYYKEFIV
jgi:hypothetical protein